MDNFDKKLEEIYTSDIELPEWYKYTVRNTLKEHKQNAKLHYRKTYKPLIAVASCLLLITTAVFACNNKEISENIKNFFKVNKGMDTAIENGYIAKPEMEYVNSNNVEIKIDNFLMDDFNLCFVLNIKFDNSIDISKMNKVNLTNFIITDECKRIVYCDNRNVFDEHVLEENLDYQYNEFNENYINNGVNYYVKNTDLETNTISLVYNLYTDSNYPKSKKLSFKFSNINYIDDNTSKNISLVGDWNFDLEVPEEFYNRTGIIYQVKSCSDERINVEKAIVYDTCMKFEFDMTLYNDEISKEEVIKKIDEKNNRFNILLKEVNSDEVITQEELKILDKALKEDFTIFSNTDEDEFVKNGDGKIFTATNSSTEDFRCYPGTETGIIEYYQTYSLTKYDITDELEVHLKYYDDGNWEDIVIVLERN